MAEVPGCWYVLSPTREETSYSDQIVTFANHSEEEEEEEEGGGGEGGGGPSNQVSAAAMTSASNEKWRPFNCFFQSSRAKDLSAHCRFFPKRCIYYPLYLTKWTMSEDGHNIQTEYLVLMSLKHVGSCTRSSNNSLSYLHFISVDMFSSNLMLPNTLLSN